MINAIFEMIEYVQKPVRIVFVDTGEIIKLKNGRSYDTFEHKGKRYVMNLDLINNNTLFFNSQLSEPVKLQPSKNDDDWKYFIETDRFNTVFKNQVLKQMMYVQEKNLLFYMLIGIAVLGALVLGNIYYTNMIVDQLNQFQLMADSVDVWS